ncbi:DUF2254 domain-containing protein [Roseovarius sp. D22-M7]|uniref:DUF2254 domain-containing protein n=1 Tax=Roseovarius sp. D22-M7 TaxID=3127116 RepID=UPI00300FBFBE
MTFQTLSTWAMTLVELSRTLWLRVSLFALLAVLGAGIAILLEGRIPTYLQDRFTTESVMPILSILASGMLAVSTFSLNVMVTAHNAAAQQTTPRVHRILLADATTHTALAVFIGAFVYALTAIILIKSNVYPEGSSVLVLGITVAVVVLVVLMLVRWIHRLSDLGSMDATLDATEALARDCLIRTRRLPALGAMELSDGTVPNDAVTPVVAPRTGYLQFIDMPRISQRLKSDQTRVYIHVRPGDYMIEGETIGHAAGLDARDATAIARGMTIGAHRTFEQDASYGLLVLSEIASRALSQGINDPGTAIAVICRQEKLLLGWAHTAPQKNVPLFPRIFLRDAARRAMIENAFAGIARDGAGQIEVALRLRAALGRVAQTTDPGLVEAARDMLALASDHADAALPLDSERLRLRAAADGISAWP